MFQKLQKKIKELFEEKGQGVVEYALILGVVAILAVTLIQKGNLDGTIEQSLGDVDAAGYKIHTDYTTASSAAAPTHTG